MSSRGTTQTGLADFHADMARQLVRAGVLHAHALLRTEALLAPQMTTIERRGHHGSPSRAIDVLMDAAMKEKLRIMHPEAIYLSEESVSGINLEPGTIIFTCDPLDGTTNALTIGGGWAVVGYFSQVRDDRTTVSLLGGAIGTADLTTVTWSFPSRPGHVRIESPALSVAGIDNRLLEHSGAAIMNQVTEAKTMNLKLSKDEGVAKHVRRGSAGKIACVAASAKRRRLLHSLYDLDATDVWYSNLAGNPLIAPLLQQELGAIIEPEPVRLYDAAYLVAVRMVGGTVTSLNGHRIDVLETFQDTPDIERDIGPFVATVDREIAAKIKNLRRAAAQAA